LGYVELSKVLQDATISRQILQNQGVLQHFAALPGTRYGVAKVILQVDKSKTPAEFLSTLCLPAVLWKNDVQIEVWQAARLH
jgi:hypothetical protein